MHLKIVGTFMVCAWFSAIGLILRHALQLPIRDTWRGAQSFLKAAYVVEYSMGYILDDRHTTAFLRRE
jgi:hypothetical protein